MGDFVRHHPGHLGLALRGQDQPGVDADESAGQRKGIDLRIAHHEKLEFLARGVAARKQPLAEAVDVIGGLGIVVIGRITADLPHDVLPKPVLVGGGNRSRGYIAEFRQCLCQHARHESE